MYQLEKHDLYKVGTESLQIIPDTRFTHLGFWGTRDKGPYHTNACLLIYLLPQIVESLPRRSFFRPVGRFVLTLA